VGAAPAPTPTTAAASPATARATGAQCTQRAGRLYYSGTVTNTSGAASAFAVDAVFVNGSGARLASATATVRTLAPKARTTWQVSVPVGRDLRNTGASCEVARVRPV
jgi:hypothetical protein